MNGWMGVGGGGGRINEGVDEWMVYIDGWIDGDRERERERDACFRELILFLFSPDIVIL